MVPDKGKKYLEDLIGNIEVNGLLQPLQLAVSRKTGRAYLYEGNHRIAALKHLEVEWIPVKVHYHFLNDDFDEKYSMI